MDCDPTCLYMVCRYYGRVFALEKLRELTETFHVAGSKTDFSFEIAVAYFLLGDYRAASDVMVNVVTNLLLPEGMVERFMIICEKYLLNQAVNVMQNSKLFHNPAAMKN